MILPLRLTYGLVPLLAGLDKFLNLLTDWPQYVAPGVAGALPFSAATLMHVIGPVEMAVGFLVLVSRSPLGPRLAAVWLTSIAVNLVLAGRFDVAVRDLAMAVGAWTLARLTVREAVASPAVRASVARSEGVPA
jgi:hypothetical protein